MTAISRCRHLTGLLGFAALAARACGAGVTPEGIIDVSDWNAGLRVLEYKGKQPRASGGRGR